MVTQPFGTTTYYRHQSRRRRVLALLVAGVALLAVAGVTAGFVVRSQRGYGPSGPGQTSYQIDHGRVVSSAGQQAVPIASPAKGMTAYLVLRDPDDVTVTVTDDDVADTQRPAR